MNPQLRALIYTTLFPNSTQPLHGTFILERMRHLLPFVDMSVVAPVPYFPRINVNQRWFNFAEAPHVERFAGFEVDHPRYLVIPRIGMTTHGFSMFAGSLPQVWRRLRAADVDLIDAHYIYPDGLAAVMLGALLKKPVVVSARGSDINLFPKFAAIRPMVRQVLKRADAVIAVSRPLKNAMDRSATEARPAGGSSDCPFRGSPERKQRLPDPHRSCSTSSASSARRDAGHRGGRGAPASSGETGTATGSAKSRCSRRRSEQST